jgi:hypothetical protein
VCLFPPPVRAVASVDASANAASVINEPADKVAKRVKGREHRFIPGSPCEPSAQIKKRKTAA